MRQAGVIADLERARQFADYLLAIGIQSRVDEGEGGGKIWVYDAEQLARARQELAAFNESPDDARYRKRQEAETIRRLERREQELAKRRFIDVRASWRNRRGARPAPLTLSLIVICVGLHMVLHYAPATPGLQRFFNGFYISLAPGLLWHHLQAGELWRLVTPTLLHGSLLHLGFNMLWLYSLGSQIENTRGRWLHVGLLIVFAVASDLAQYLWSGPHFLGMSGVVYGLFGYVWMQARYAPRPDLFIDKANAVILMGWLVLCMSGLLGNVANAAHVGGLVAGVVAGSGPYLRRKLRG